MIMSKAEEARAAKICATTRAPHAFWLRDCAGEKSVEMSISQRSRHRDTEPARMMRDGARGHAPRVCARVPARSTQMDRAIAKRVLHALPAVLLVTRRTKRATENDHLPRAPARVQHEDGIGKSAFAVTRRLLPLSFFSIDIDCAGNANTMAVTIIGDVHSSHATVPTRNTAAAKLSLPCSE